MKLIDYRMVYANCALAVCACSISTDDELRERIERIENGMLPAAVVTGEGRESGTIHEIMEHFNVPGVSVAVINDGALEWAKGYGVLESGGPAVNTETLFLAGHMSQLAAVMGALKLVDDGRLYLDEDLNDRMQSWKVPDNEFTASEKVTLRRIMSHTSGLTLRSLTGYSVDGPIPNIQQVLEGVSPSSSEAIRVTSTPGSQQQYSLGGYVVMQQLIEDVTGRPYADFIDSNVLSPLGMSRSNHIQPLSEELTSNAARGYDSNNRQVSGRWRLYPELAALGMWTTPSDLAKLIVELQKTFAGQSELVVSQTMAEEMLSQQFENRGLGVEIGGVGEWQYFRLEGHGNNYLSELFGYVSQGMGAVVMTNSSNGEAVKAHILRAVAAEYGWPDLLPEEVEAVPLTEETLRELEGIYSFRGRDRVLRLMNGRLIQSTDGGPDQELRALSDSVLVSPAFGYRYEVDRDSSGTVTGLTLILNGTRLFTYQRN